MVAKPDRAGALIYALDLEHLAGSYETLLAMTRLHADTEHIALSGAAFQPIVHAIPGNSAAGIVVKT
jgi:hypothetical protein